MRISDWSSDVCSSDLLAGADVGFGRLDARGERGAAFLQPVGLAARGFRLLFEQRAARHRRRRLLLGVDELFALVPGDGTGIADIALTPREPAAGKDDDRRQ